MNGDKVVITNDEFTFGHRKSNLILNHDLFATPLHRIGTKSQLYVVRIGDLVDAVLKGQIFGYKKNRGTGQPEVTLANEIAASFKPDAFGTIFLADQDNGTFKVNEGHSRICALLIMRQQETIDSHNDTFVTVQVSPSEMALAIYSDVNHQRGHSIKAKLTNDDYPFGKLLKRFFSGVNTSDFRGVEIVGKGHYPLTAQLLYIIGTADDPTTIDFSQVSRIASKEVARLANKIGDEFNLSVPLKRQEELTKAYNYAIDVFSDLVMENDQSNGKGDRAKLPSLVNSVLSSTMLFMFLVWDKYTGANIITELDAKTLAARMSNKISDLSIATSMLSAKSFPVGKKKLFDILRTKKKDVFSLT